MALPTLADVLQWGAWLAEARLAYHRLMTGQAAVEIAVDGATYVTKFAKPNAAELQSYITRLEGQIAGAALDAPRGSAIGFIA